MVSSQPQQSSLKRYHRNVRASFVVLLGLAILAFPFLSGDALEEVRSLRSRRLADFVAETPLHVVIGSHSNAEGRNTPQEEDEGSPSNDHSNNDINFRDPSGDDESLTRFSSDLNKDGNRSAYYAVAALAVAGILILMSAVVAFMIWRKCICHLFVCPKYCHTGEEGDGDFGQGSDQPHNLPTPTGDSILRDPIAPASSSISGRRVRFALPGMSSSVDQAAVASAEIDEANSILDDEQQRNSGRFPNGDNVVISVEPTTTQPIAGNYSSAVTSYPHVASKSNDPETWVSRILHPFVDSPFCCPENWEGRDTTKSNKLCLFDDTTTIATPSFESSSSSKSNGASSLTPILPSFPTSSLEGKTDDDNESKQGFRRAAVLGIQSPHDVRDDEAAWVADRRIGSHRKRNREQVAPRGVESGQETFGNGQLSSPRSPWRKKIWMPPEGMKPVNASNSLSTQSKQLGISPVEEEFDVESYNNGSELIVATEAGFRSGSLAEI